MFDDKNLLYSLSALSAAVKIGFYTQQFETAEEFWIANNQSPLRYGISTRHKMVIVILSNDLGVAMQVTPKYLPYL